MLYNYIALLFFLLFGIGFPAALLLGAKIIGRKPVGNPVKNAPYESGEVTIGSSMDVDNEYLPYYMLFLPFELIVAVLIIWSTVSNKASFGTGIMVIALAIAAMAISLIGYKIASDKHV
ncbi:MAG: NADH-quinone oxidoreductase subunit A [Candidatus Marsarchaeota archaeon]|jgi:NADH:ubiquinone oxidoreductase subunit 3 (subunit A)|nr:NADH-quinone oxidoreductase subunit A [Candidatus Marsarchaeota archaeon]MCL5112585.1 NADH-quinone oxidoreductase subunit A [Candidatus Marsarchaeota archaeon]